MARLTKRDGTHEEYQRSKVADSLRRLGASEETINTTLQRVTPTDGESTTSFRNRITAELRARSPEMARRYENSHRLDAGRSDTVPEGTARVNPNTLRHYGWKPGDNVNAQHGNTSVTIRVESSDEADVRMADFNSSTLRSLGAAEGTRISFTKKS